jgi:hypothetical protein
MRPYFRAPEGQYLSILLAISYIWTLKVSSTLEPLNLFPEPTLEPCVLKNALEAEARVIGPVRDQRHILKPRFRRNPAIRHLGNIHTSR